MGATRGAKVAVGAAIVVGAIALLAVLGVAALIATVVLAPRDSGGFPGDSGTSAEVATPAAAPTAEDGTADPAWLAETAQATGIPERALAAYAAADVGAGTEGCAVGWNTLAGIGWVESHHGTLQGGAIDADGVARPAIVGIPLDGTNETMAIPDTDGGAFDGDAAWDRAVGPMQFIPETWARWAVDASGDGRADPHSIDDAAATAARYLCRLDGTLADGEQWIRAIRSYNDTLDYQTRVATAAERYAAAAR
ncbi:lytic transglycosylase domain-containing protein [Microbacterium halophytorum]|uniref:lytic transglycosylase domain-containing protein n=1 Tax=Microbacterium halophytorum TaxID=2067568 RepID=UPI000CFB4301|nr:lytic murein transglycosylase [Microbacterium halophytorum]